MERVSWQRTPPPMLERVIEAEAVHQITSWEELKQRLGHNRRVFVLTHPALPAEPLAMLEIALTPHVAPSVAGLLAEDTWASASDASSSGSGASGARWGGALSPHFTSDSREACCAIFY